jgi:hypothetical protein
MPLASQAMPGGMRPMCAYGASRRSRDREALAPVDDCLARIRVRRSSRAARLVQSTRRAACICRRIERDAQNRGAHLGAIRRAVAGGTQLLSRRADGGVIARRVGRTLRVRLAASVEQTSNRRAHLRAPTGKAGARLAPCQPCRANAAAGSAARATRCTHYYSRRPKTIRLGCRKMNRCQRPKKSHCQRRRRRP